MADFNDAYFLKDLAMSSEVSAIATPEAYRTALLTLRDKGLPHGHFAMLRAQCRAPSYTITATQLAEAADYENYNAANLQYGTLASNVAHLLGYVPVTRTDGSTMWWTTLSYSSSGDDESNGGHFQFIMRPELVAALREMRWA
jgi:hypothetical protein